MKQSIAIFFLTVSCLISFHSFSAEQQSEIALIPSISLSLAKRMAEDMEKKARTESSHVVIYILGADGRALLVHRDDRSGMAPLEWARNKAITSYQTKKQTKDLSDTIDVRRADTFSFVLGMAGGIPLVYKGERVGAIGVSGGALHIDQSIAEEGLKTFNTVIDSRATNK